MSLVVAVDTQVLSFKALLTTINRKRLGCLLPEKVVYVLFLGEKSAMTKRRDPKYRHTGGATSKAEN